MYIVQRPTETRVETKTCDFHKRHPGKTFPGCTCVTSISSREKRLSEMTAEEQERYIAACRGEKPDGTVLF